MTNGQVVLIGTIIGSFLGFVIKWSLIAFIIWGVYTLVVK